MTRAIGPAAMLLFGSAGIVIFFASTVIAMHAVDHRFTVEGYVCGADGQPVPDTQVIAKDARVFINATGYTDSSGYYKATLHLHNDNRGDPIVVTALDQEQRVTAQFDTKDFHTERRVTVNFGSGCAASAGGPNWIYYSAGIGLAAVAAFAGIRLIRSRQRSRKRGKGQRK